MGNDATGNDAMGNDAMNGDGAATTAAAEPPTYSAFFYGTLMAPEVFFTVCFRLSNPPEAVRRLYKFRPAVLHGYCRHRVRHADYPGIVEEAGADVRGSFVEGLTAENMAKLDYFEGREYERRQVALRLLDRTGDGRGQGNVEGAEVHAQVYVYKDRKHLEDREWDFDEFRRDKLKLWAREDYAFADCDPEKPATTAGDETTQS